MGWASASPVCPVERNPPDPACAPRAVSGALILVRDAAGNPVAKATTAADGTYAVALAAGSYTVEAQPMDGLMGTPAPAPVIVPPGVAAGARLDFSYDTGIR